jgi:hypothetical protein
MRIARGSGRIDRVERNRVLVAVFEISDDAGEDRWADAMWRAEAATKQAAVDAGAAEGDVTISRHHQGYVICALSDGREFEARVATNPALPAFAFPSLRGAI